MRGWIALSLTAALALEAQGRGFTDDAAGTVGAQFLKLGADARSAGMAGAVRAFSEDAGAVYWNPAGLAGLGARHLSLTHAAYYQSVFYDYIAYAQPVQSVLAARRERELRPSQLGAFGVAILYLNSGKISEVDNTGTATGGNFTPQDTAVLAGWGAKVTRQLDLGISGKFISSRISESASTGAFDLGVRLRTRLIEMPWTIAAGVHNVGGRLKYIAEEDPLPLSLSLAQALRPVKDWALTADLVAPKDGDLYPAFGTEYRFVWDATLSAWLRLGYSRRTSGTDLDGLTGLAAGGGLGLSRFTVDYAWAPFGVLGDTHRFSLSYRF